VIGIVKIFDPFAATAFDPRFQIFVAIVNVLHLRERASRSGPFRLKPFMAAFSPVGEFKFFADERAGFRAGI
jgi:hypothetical protein